MKNFPRRKLFAGFGFFAILPILLALLFFLLGRDRLVETREEGDFADHTLYRWVTHRFEKGEELSLNVGVSKLPLGEGLYQLAIVVNGADDPDYGIAALNATLISPTETEFLNALVGKGDGRYDLPALRYGERTKIQSFGGDCYLYYSAVVRDGSSEDMTLELRYRIEGKNRFILNKFYGNAVSLTIAFPEGENPS
ncbi:MAG: hypothetical protein NC084_03240 [Bacteroides sp.]|nr:hypothetical protein [Eubacterium sp.]MCM1417578.1 hypothetical protein [Roseburia sp.]MCM1461711.1 hypothetical protein [Bacteroides sp.]